MIDGWELTRRHDWVTRLDAFIQARMNEPFRWGINDCCTFAAGAVAAMTGVDFCAVAAVSYHSAVGAREAAETITGTRAMARAITRLPEALGFNPCAATVARRGDLVLINRHPSMSALGIISLDARYAIAPGRFGLARVPRSQCIAAWRVG